MRIMTPISNQQYESPTNVNLLPHERESTKEAIKVYVEVAI
jgi:hypothetical protein